MRRLLITSIGLAGALTLALGSAIGTGTSADAAPVVRDIAFPVREEVYYRDTFGACRDGCSRRHEGQDLIGGRLNHLLAAADAEVEFIRSDASGTAGNWIKLVDDAGWHYSYMHVNNDAPGTDDGANPDRWRFARGIEVGARVQKGQFIAYMGDSGNAEGSVPHLHFEIRKPDGTPINAYASLQAAEGKPVEGICGSNTAPTPEPQAGSLGGYVVLGDGGTVAAFGSAVHVGDRSTDGVASPAVGIAATPSGAGYWIATRNGAVHRYGDATVAGDAAKMRLGTAVVAIASLPNGRGFWLATEDGGVIPFGAARSYGDAQSRPLSSTVVDIASTSSGRGYWLVTNSGTVYAFGDAMHRGDASKTNLISPIVSIVPVPGGGGYWLVSRRGGLITYGSAQPHGTIPMLGLCKPKPTADLVPSSDGGGYAIVQVDGVAQEFGNADAPGDATGAGVIVDVARIP
jgi:Peptidase family M23